MAQSYDDFKKENRLKLFGHEDAVKEKEERLSSYYYKTTQYEDVISDIGMQIIIGEKGTGKSALLKMAFMETKDSDVTTIWIRLDELSELYNEILNAENLYQLKTLWKRSISKLVVMKLASSIELACGEDYEKALQWAYSSGYASRDFIARTAKMLKPMYEKYITPEIDDLDKGERGVMLRMIEHKQVRLFFDDFDLDWKGNAQDILKIKSLLLSLSDMTSDMDGLSVRIALRTDVYDMIRNEEFSDKLESSIIRCKWNNREIIKALAKRICSYYNIFFDEEATRDDLTMQYNLVKYLNYVFEARFDKSTRVWGDAPTHRVIFSLIRRKPRDMVKLCLSVAEDAYSQKLNKINAACFLNILESYSQERLKDLVNEYRNQLPKLQDLLVRMAPTKLEIQSKSSERYVYSTTELHTKIKNIQQNMSLKIYQPISESLQMADFHQISHFLYKIGFITGRKRNLSGKISRVYFDESPYLLNINTGDGGYAWEIHPAYRGALAKGINDSWENTLDVEDDEDDL
ncbi:MAG: hypothetical protein K0S76_739 [Herbinix sp.]|jgi:hypothetical protein|nr:hypothetical protein [Herbinix sp.]